MLRSYGHNLKKLLQRADAIAERRGLSGFAGRLPRTAIHNGIIEVLSDFAMNITRYYNLDLVTGDPRAAGEQDPIRAWFEQVVMPVLAAHQRPRQRARIHRNAQLVSDVLGQHAIVRYHDETGKALDSVFEASKQTGMTNSAKPYVRMYVMHIARFLANLLSELGTVAHRSQLDTVPYLSEFFAIFNNSDKYFRQRKTWSIYRP